MELINFDKLEKKSNDIIFYYHFNKYGFRFLYHCFEHKDKLDKPLLLLISRYTKLFIFELKFLEPYKELRIQVSKQHHPSLLFLDSSQNKK